MVHYSTETVNSSHSQYNTNQRSSYVASQQPPLVMTQPTHPAFIHPLPMPPVSPVMVPVWDYSSLWWDQTGSPYPPVQSHSHPRVHRFSSQETVERAVRKRK